MLYNGFLDPLWCKDRSSPVTLEEHLSRPAERVAGTGGWEHVGIGSDLDGGFGCDECPAGVETVADLGLVGAALPAEAREAVLGRNWLDFLASSLPRNP